MNEILKYERKLYFKDRKHYIISLITNDHNYMIWKYVMYLRKEEASKSKIGKYYYRRKKNTLGVKLGLLVYAGSCETGLHIWHYGSVIINGYSKIGENCTFHGQNCIGNDGKADKDTKAPILGKNIDVGVGASIIGDVYIADNVKIGAGAVVLRSCHTPGATLVGVPAKEVLNKDREGNSKEICR